MRTVASPRAACLVTLVCLAILATTTRLETFTSTDVRISLTLMLPVPTSVVGMLVSEILEMEQGVYAVLICSTALSPWTALEYCSDLEGVNNTWSCHAPESCGCDWNATESLLVLAPRGCKAMGKDARVALYAPSALAPFVSLPATVGGSTGYYSPTIISNTSSWVSTAISGCKNF